MKTKVKISAGPLVDKAFFDDMAEVFAMYPEEARKFAIRSTALEIERMHIDYSRKVGVPRVEGDRIIVEFHDRDDDVMSGGDSMCCETTDDGHCIKLCKV